ncbi:MAG: arginine--tRNA ligase [Bacilli bacterium]|nr:arginine--tRNA ligase [Bacilli bacterium]
MTDIKQIISSLIEKEINIDVYDYIKEIEDSSKGDYAFPCFSLSKEMHKSPVDIANELVEKIKDERIDKIESVNGYLNFFINREYLAKFVLSEYDNDKENYGKEKHDETVLIEYSSPNVCKPFHIGHMRTTLIGHALYNIFKYMGYNTISINHLGDYGTQFGKLIEGYRLWGSEYDLSTDSMDKLVEIYVRINDLCANDESVLERCRENFRKLEDKDPECVALYEQFKELSLKEFKKTYDMLGIHFDSIRGEASYVDSIDEVINMLEAKNKLQISEGATIVDLTDEGINAPCIVKKSDGSSIYASRDLAAILYRARTYDFDKCIYVTGYEQDLHFKQVFAVAKYLDLDKKYVDGLEHVSYGLYSLKEGKMSTRKGNFIKLEDVINESISRAKEVILEKNPELEDIDETAKKVGIGAVIFSDLYNSRIKDEVFDLDTMLNFQGETSPYIQYMYVRIQSILKKTNDEVLLNNVSYDKLTDDLSYALIKTIYSYNSVLNEVINKKEPYLLSRYLIKLANEYSSFYSNNKVLDDNDEIRKTRLYLISMVGEILKSGMNLLGIEMPNKM